MKTVSLLALGTVGLLTGLCLALPTANPSGDAWYYAACARWGHELWQPHHLLYNAVGWGWLRLLGVAGPAALRGLQALNALAYGGCLLVLAALLRRAGARPATVPAWLLAVGGSFGMLRFAVDNEAYVQPLLLALLASYCWSSASRAASGQQPTSKTLLAAGLLAALACLLHQVMAWWWLGLLVGLRPWGGRAARRAGLLYAIPALLVPLAYALAAPPGSGASGPLRFALHDYLSGAAHVAPGVRGLLLTPVSLLRTFGQLHGNLLPLLRRWPLPLGAVAAGCLALLGWAAWPRRWHLAQLQAAPVMGADSPASAACIRCTHLLIALVQLGFAALAAGNAEFMVMLPALLALGLAGGQLRAWPAGRVAALGLALLGWNVAFALLPAHALSYTDAGPALRARVQRQPGAWFLLLDPNPLRNQLHYYTGRPVAPPRVLGLAGQDSARFRAWLRQRLAAGDTVYTDALGSAGPLDRARLLQGEAASHLLRGFGAERVVALPTFFGPVYLSKLGLAGKYARPAVRSTRASATVTTGAAR